MLTTSWQSIHGQEDYRHMNEAHAKARNRGDYIVCQVAGASLILVGGKGSHLYA